MAQRAAAILALGTCASFGGISAAAPNPGNHRPLADVVPPGKPLIRLPGCPPHPEWIIETLVSVLTKGANAGMIGLNTAGTSTPNPFRAVSVRNRSLAANRHQAALWIPGGLGEFAIVERRSACAHVVNVPAKD